MYAILIFHRPSYRSFFQKVSIFYQTLAVWDRRVQEGLARDCVGRTKFEFPAPQVVPGVLPGIAFEHHQAWSKIFSHPPQKTTSSFLTVSKCTLSRDMRCWVTCTNSGRSSGSALSGYFSEQHLLYFVCV